MTQPVHVLAAVDDIIDGQLEQRLQQEKQSNNGARAVLIPCNLGMFHWVGILLEFQADGQISRAEYIDSLGTEDVSTEVSLRLQRQITSIYPSCVI